jgi:hypothetical protein
MIWVWDNQRGEVRRNTLWAMLSSPMAETSKYCKVCGNLANFKDMYCHSCGSKFG